MEVVLACCPLQGTSLERFGEFSDRLPAHHPEFLSPDKIEHVSHAFDLEMKTVRLSLLVCGVRANGKHPGVHEP